MRLSYLHPEARFGYENGNVLVDFKAAPTFPAREITYQVYREKIYQESLPMRRLLYATLLT